MFFSYNADIDNENPWIILEEGVKPMQEREIESLFSFGNGYVGTRCSFVENYDFCDPATFVAGLYEKSPGKNFNELVKVPDWTRMQIFVEDNYLDIINNQVLEHNRYLDLKKGIITREWRSQDPDGRITDIKIHRYISMANKNEAFKNIIIKPVNYSGKIKVISGIDGSQSNFIFPVPEMHQSPQSIMLAMRVEGTENLVVISQKSEFLRGAELISLVHSIQTPLYPSLQGEIRHTHGYDEELLYEAWEWMAEHGQEYTINCLV